MIDLLQLTWNYASILEVVHVPGGVVGFSIVSTILHIIVDGVAAAVVVASVVDYQQEVDCRWRWWPAERFLIRHYVDYTDTYSYT